MLPEAPRGRRPTPPLEALRSVAGLAPSISPRTRLGMGQPPGERSELKGESEIGRRDRPPEERARVALLEQRGERLRERRQRLERLLWGLRFRSASRPHRTLEFPRPVSESGHDGGGVVPKKHVYNRCTAVVTTCTRYITTCVGFFGYGADRGGC